MPNKQQVKEFVVENQTQILTGALVLVMLKNRRLRRDNAKLAKDAAAMTKTLQDVIPQMKRAAEILGRQSVFDQYFGPRR
jgi:hypothetical protein